MPCGVRGRRACPRTRRKGPTARTAAATTAATQITTRRTADSWHKETLRDKEPTRETNVELREENQKERVIGEYSCSLVALPVFERVRLFSMRLYISAKSKRRGIAVVVFWAGGSVVRTAFIAE
jgi:hypothetical protein